MIKSFLKYYSRLATAMTLAVTLIIPVVNSRAERNNPDVIVSALTGKDSVVILITDSGLGGISVQALLEQHFREKPSFSYAKLLFVNALHSAGKKYNYLGSESEKAGLFDQFLESVTDKYKPDLILIACNTLSVVYERTRYRELGKVPVIGIVDLGIKMISDELKSSGKSRDVIIIGTETTISSGDHINGLVKSGADISRVHSQVCPSLESEIQQDPDGEMIKSLLEFYAGEAKEKLSQPADTIAVALCCSHYGFIASRISSEFEKGTGSKIKILNPNYSMSGLFNLLPPKQGKQAIESGVVSQVTISPEERSAIGGMIKEMAPLTYYALLNYNHIPGLFGK